MRGLRSLWNRTKCIESVMEAFNLKRREAVSALKKIGVVDPEHHEDPISPQDEILRQKAIDDLLTGAPFLSSGDLQEEFGRQTTTVDYELAAICAEARGLKIKGSRTRWEIVP